MTWKGNSGKNIYS